MQRALEIKPISLQIFREKNSNKNYNKRRSPILNFAELIKSQQMYLQDESSFQNFHMSLNNYFVIQFS